MKRKFKIFFLIDDQVVAEKIVEEDFDAVFYDVPDSEKDDDWRIDRMHDEMEHYLDTRTHVVIVE